MSTRFANSIQQLAMFAGTPDHYGRAELASEDAGRALATEFMEAARAGALPPDGLMFAIKLCGKSGGQSPFVMRGFLRELQQRLAEVPA